MQKREEQLRKAHDNYFERKYNVANKIEECRGKVNAKRVNNAKKSLYEFIKTYGPGAICEFPPAKEMKPLLDTMQRCADSIGGRYQIQMSRGFGKTTFVGALALFRLIRGDSHFIEIIAATDGKATDIFDTIITMFSSEKFGQDFPDVSIPLEMSGGNSIRMSRLHYNGQNINMEQRSGRFILPRVPGSIMSQAKIVIKSFTAKDLRGLNILTERPDFIILDDIQTDDMALNPQQVRKAVKTINQVIRGQFAHNKQGAMLMTATPIFPGDVSEVIKDDPGWITMTYPMMLKMPTNEDLWKQYGNVLHAEIASIAINEKPKETAMDFYKKHRDELDAGAEPLSPHAYIHGRELSAIQHAMNIIYGTADGLEVFETEYQMKPRRSQSVYDIDYKTILHAANGLPPLKIPNMCNRIFAAIDVMKTAGLRWVILAVGADRIAAVVNYGRFPANNEPLFNSSDMLPVKQTKVVNAVMSLVDNLQTATFSSVDGRRVYKIGAIAIDAGWMYRSIVSFCSTRPNCYAMRGMNFSTFAPRNSSGHLSAGVIDASDWLYEKQVEFGSFIAFHSDYWRETAQRAWLNAPLQPSSLSVFGDASQHLQFAQECVADQLIEKDKMKSGADTWRWAVNGANHLGDCVTMCLAIANWRRCYSVGGDIGQDAISPSAVCIPNKHKAKRRFGVVCL